MGKKERFIFLELLILIFIFSGLISAQSCSVTERASCGDNIVMGLSASTNAHGQLNGQIPEYSYVLCCDFGSGDTVCDDTNKIIGLGALATNAHGEIPENDNYDYDVCYESLTCASSSGSCPDGYDIEMFSLTGETNAHIGGFGDYSTKICCSAEAPPGVPYWRDKDGDTDLNNDGTSDPVEEIIVVLDQTRVFATIFDSSLDPGTEVSADIYEDDYISDDFIRTLTGNVYSDNNINLLWTITQADLDKTSDLDNFYFKINDVRSNNELKFDVSEPGFCSGINICGDYQAEEECNQDALLCNVAGDSIDEDEADCDSEEYICGCEWNTEESECRPFYKIVSPDPEPECGNGIKETGEECDDGNTANGDGCSSDCKYECGLSKPCGAGLSLCSDNTCSLNCNFCDEGTACNYDDTCDANEGCLCSDCDGEQDQCLGGLLCSINDLGCCNYVSDDFCNPFCAYIDPDCTGAETHTECIEGTCTEVDGAGENECLPIGGDCGGVDTHAGCSSDMCVSIVGVGTDECSANDDCLISVCGNGIKETGEECDLGSKNGETDSGCSEDCEYTTVDPPCPDGLSLCSDNTCSLNCYVTDKGIACNYDDTCDANEGCLCSDCDGEQDQCGSSLLCSLIDGACCDYESDGHCNSFCRFADPDCAGGLPPGVSAIGKCIYDKTSDDDCEDDGIYEYSWLGIWEWNADNIFDSNPDGENYVFCDDTGACTCRSCDGKWHYDPDRKNEDCKDGNDSFQCPAELELPFFGVYNFIITTFFITLIYLYSGRKR